MVIAVQFLSYNTLLPRFSASGRLPIFEVFGGALIKTYENFDLPFPAHTRTLFIIYDNSRNSNILKELLN